MPGLAELLARMEKRMALANEPAPDARSGAESTILSYTRAAKRLSVKLGKTPNNVNEAELQEFLLHLKEKMSQSSWHTYLFGIRYVYIEVLEMPEMVESLSKSKVAGAARRAPAIYALMLGLVSLLRLFNEFYSPVIMA